MSILDNVQATGKATPKSVPVEELVVFLAPLPKDIWKPFAPPAAAVPAI